VKKDRRGKAAATADRRSSTALICLVRTAAQRRLDSKIHLLKLSWLVLAISTENAAIKVRINTRGSKES
jgi:hypothetical protein